MSDDSNVVTLDAYAGVLTQIKDDLCQPINAAVANDISYKEIIEIVNDIYAVAALRKHKSQTQAALVSDLNRGTFRKMLKKAGKIKSVSEGQQ